jgi:carbamoyl-phosphate synthase small subunit
VERKSAILVLEDGKAFEGWSFGREAETTGEVVFNTALCGYQEVLTDPSYAGQIVTMTYPHIGNYGVNREDVESSRPQVAGFVVREASTVASSWRASGELHRYLDEAGVVGISEIDTRELTRHLRTFGAKRGVISTLDSDPKSLLAKARGSRNMVGLDLAREVTCSEPYRFVSGDMSESGGAGRAKDGSRLSDVSGEGPHDAPFKVVAYDFGMKRNILRSLARASCEVTVVPAGTTAKEALAFEPDGIFLSNGPGDPEPCGYAIEAVKELMEHRPIFGICLGHQILGLACGGKTFKLKFGHRGANHPVKNLKTGHVEVTSQNHGFSVDPEAFDRKPELILTHRNLNDGTVEGFRHRDLPVVSVQYHPEASPGPHDSHYLFGEFVEMMAARRKARRS